MAQEGDGGAGSSLSRVPTELLTGTTAQGAGAPTMQTARQRVRGGEGCRRWTVDSEVVEAPVTCGKGMEWSELLAQETQ
jgi:hypothetical protein